MSQGSNATKLMTMTPPKKSHKLDRAAMRPHCVARCAIHMRQMDEQTVTARIFDITIKAAFLEKLSFLQDVRTDISYRDAMIHLKSNFTDGMEGRRRKTATGS